MKRQPLADPPHIVYSYECPCGEAWDSGAGDNRCAVCGGLAVSDEEIEMLDDLDDSELRCADDAA